MSEEEAAPATPERRRAPEAAASALATSVPDDNRYLMRMIRMLLGLGGGGMVRLFATVMAGSIMLIYVVAKWGVTAILALQTLILQLHSDQTMLAKSDREIQKEQVTATQEVLAALQGIGSKLDSQGHKLDEQGNQIEQLAVDVGTLKRDQADGSRRISAIAAEQKRLRADRTGG